MKYALFYGALALLAAIFLPGCAPDAPVTNISVVSDSFCRVAKKLSWSLEDTQLTIDGIRRHNARVDSCTKDKVS